MNGSVILVTPPKVQFIKEKNKNGWARPHQILKYLFPERIINTVRRWTKDWEKQFAKYTHIL